MDLIHVNRFRFGWMGFPEHPAEQEVNNENRFQNLLDTAYQLFY